MTAAARITQADIERAAKAVKNAGFEPAQEILDEIEMLLAEDPARRSLPLRTPLTPAREQENDNG